MNIFHGTMNKRVAVIGGISIAVAIAFSFLGVTPDRQLEGSTSRDNIIVYSIGGFVKHFCGPDVIRDCSCSEEFRAMYFHYPYDMDGDQDIDLADYFVFQNTYEEEFEGAVEETD